MLSTGQGGSSLELRVDSDSGVRRTVLPGGLRVVTEHLPGVRSASVGVWVGVGSRDEGPTVAGAAHFLEHLMFPRFRGVEMLDFRPRVGWTVASFRTRSESA
ncbi:insulinase family protein, partial [Nocardia sp. NPDC057455]|uniref:insulinase family protein n=1 Tax=Nocardia sp. NPDC057455 TaxID=3346138 RepID=UPI0036717784